MSISTLLTAEVQRRIFGEGYARIHNCFARLTDEQIWQRPNGQLSSMGNLVLHLCGNVRQWVLSGLGDNEDTRQRSFEFSETGPIPREELFALMDRLKVDVEAFLKTLDEERLTQIHQVQGFDESGISILVHVTEHFSYHVGQIAWYTKMLTGEDLAFYGGVDLEKKG
jgi:uncharacterized damage-inducible protein DinB